MQPDLCIGIASTDRCVELAALSLGLALGNAPGRETFIVSCSIADQAVALARYAAQAI